MIPRVPAPAAGRRRRASRKADGQRVEVQATGHRVKVHPGDSRVEIRARDDRVDVESGGNRVEIYVCADELGEVDRVDEGRHHAPNREPERPLGHSLQRGPGRLAAADECGDAARGDGAAPSIGRERATSPAPGEPGFAVQGVLDGGRSTAAAGPSAPTHQPLTPHG